MYGGQEANILNLSSYLLVIKYNTIVYNEKICSGLKISFTGPSDKMSGDIEFGSDICPMTFSSVLTRK